MRLSVLLATAAIAFAQSTTTTYITNVNGSRVPYGTSTSSDHTETELSQSINGREVPLRRTEERVLKSDPSGRVTERIVRDYNPNGDLISTQRVVIEETSLPGGGTRSHAVAYRTDVNGREQEWERRTEDTRPQGRNATKIETVIERPVPNGGFQPVEKRTALTGKTATGTNTTESVFRPNGNGEFYEARRHTQETASSSGETVEKNVEYEPGQTNTLELQSQTVARISKQPDGSERTVTDIYARSIPGITQQTGGAPQVQEQQILIRHKAADGSVTETLSARRPTINNPNQLGPVEPISETVCRGKCDK